MRISNNFLTFKKIDFWLQIITLVGVVIFMVVDANTPKDYDGYGTGIIFSSLIPSLFILGFVIVISIIINFFCKKHLVEARKPFIIVVLSLIIALIFSYMVYSFFDFRLFLGFLLLLISPFLALWYLVITWQELRILQNHLNKNLRE